MSMTRYYKCDLCNEELRYPKNSFGLNFTNLNDFTLGAYGCTEGSHICYPCARQLKKHLNNEQISKLID